jgi:CBS domain-containing protein
MSAIELCKKMLVTLNQDATLEEAAQSMRRNRVGAIVVMAAGFGRIPVGMITDRDLAIKGLGESRPNSTPIKEIMSKNLLTINQDADLQNVMEKMSQKGVRRIVLVDETGAACGLVSFDDAFQRLIQQMNGLLAVVHKQNEQALDQSCWDEVVL